MLFGQIGEHAVACRQLEALNNPLQQFFEANDRLDVIAGRVEPDDHIAAAVREAFENRKQDLVFVISWAVGLDPGAEVRR